MKSVISILVCIMLLSACGKRADYKDKPSVESTPNPHLSYVGEVNAKCAKFVYKDDSGKILETELRCKEEND